MATRRPDRLGDLARAQPVRDVLLDVEVREQRVALEDRVDVALVRRDVCARRRRRARRCRRWAPRSRRASAASWSCRSPRGRAARRTRRAGCRGRSVDRGDAVEALRHPAQGDVGVGRVPSCARPPVTRPSIGLHHRLSPSPVEPAWRWREVSRTGRRDTPPGGVCAAAAAPSASGRPAVVQSGRAGRHRGPVANHSIPPSSRPAAARAGAPAGADSSPPAAAARSWSRAAARHRLPDRRRAGQLSSARASARSCRASAAAWAEGPGIGNLILPFEEVVERARPRRGTLRRPADDPVGLGSWAAWTASSGVRSPVPPHKTVLVRGRWERIANAVRRGEAYAADHVYRLGKVHFVARRPPPRAPSGAGAGPRGHQHLRGRGRRAGRRESAR